MIKLYIIQQVDEILAAKKLNINKDAAEIEKGINQLVYQLYGLTDEEIEIVESSFK